jgi:tetratricopeptide (TPR) repeat protein
MSDHVSADLADLLAGRLSPEREREVMRHIESCADCSAEHSFASRFVESALEQGLAHVRSERILVLADQVDSATPMERLHLESCELCRAEIEWARRTQDVPPSRAGDVEPAVRPRSSWWRPRVWVPAAAAVAATVVVVMFIRGVPEPAPRPYAGLIVAEPLPVRIPRSTAPADSFEIARSRGLEGYVAGEYADAMRHFEEALAMRPGDPELLLYAGSSRLLTGDPVGAASRFEEGLKRADSSELRAELSWQLADTRLETGDVAGARRLLEALAREDDGYARDARRVLERIR